MILCFLLPVQLSGQWFAYELNDGSKRPVDLKQQDCCYKNKIDDFCGLYMLDQKHLCSLFNPCNLLSPFLYRNYSKVNNELSKVFKSHQIQWAFWTCTSLQHLTILIFSWSILILSLNFIGSNTSFLISFTISSFSP